METAHRTITADVIAALTYWPGVLVAGQEHPPKPVDLTVLPPFFNGLLQELPWWNHDWRVVHAEPGLPLERERNLARATTRFTEVSVPGTIGSGSGETLPFVAKVRFTGDQLVRFQAKLGDMVVSPAEGPAGQLEPHPFGAVFTRLMDAREISVRAMARQTFRAESTIRQLRDGRLNPHPDLAKEVADVLGISEADIRAIAGLDDST
ncbi:XRE family transcriptional regulator [Actinomadura spongiicola]|uniref:XRE family transcriptional regulator n=1 Tax=Actinomadura spongiicola TaxID=2303421 RepID=A0A372GA44_9ACTN|nr:helix-turn-helix transcriptional regulator [Actinomadura spongiicola]RFS82268.1 XRE family transcriptional regulator [Actinomadura spongiicola]